MIYERILKEKKEVEQRITELQGKIQMLPEGKLTCCHHDKRRKWYCSDGHSRIYIPQSDREFAEQLAIKKYLSCQLEDLQHEKVALDFYLRHYQPSHKICYFDTIFLISSSIFNSNGIYRKKLLALIPFLT